MVRIRKTAGSGIRKNKVLLSFEGEDKKLHEVLLPPAVAMQAAVSIIRTVRDLPEVDALTQAQLASLFEAIFAYLGT